MKCKENVTFYSYIEIFSFILLESDTICYALSGAQGQVEPLIS